MTINSTPIEKLTRVANSDGYAYHRLLIPNQANESSPGSVQSVTVNAGGSGYTSAPTVGFTGGGGSGAAATAVLGFGVGVINVTNSGNSYTTATVSITGGGGSGATATANISGGSTILSITVNNPGSGYTSAPTITITGDGVGATANSTLDSAGSVKSVTVTNGGSNYTSVPTVSFTGGAGTGATATAVTGSPGLAVTVPLSFDLPVDDYTIAITPSQACNVSYDNKSTTGVDIVLTPLNSSDELTDGLFDVIIDYTY
jgi:hypothetical protein